MSGMLNNMITFIPFSMRKINFYFLTVFLMMLLSCSGRIDQGNDAEESILALVNPFIGTGGHGHTFPGATLPHAMVQLSPDTRTMGWDACSGYHYSDESILGFSHTHLSGTGIGDYGDVLFMPFTGEAKVVPGTPENPDGGYRSRFSHENEISTPGYYSTYLDDYDVKVELTTSLRTGFHRYTYPAEKPCGLIIDLSHTIHGHANPVNEFRIISDTEIEGYKRTSGWARNHHVYFYAKFNKPFQCRFYKQGEIQPENESITSENAQAVLLFNNEDPGPLLIKVGISSVDYAGARLNLQTEIDHWNFDRVKKNAGKIWNQQLSRIMIKGATRDEQVIFTTALYHSFIHPNISTDADGRYRGMDQQIYQADEEPIYTVFSLWDTFRALHPLMTLIDPETDNEYIQSLLVKYREGGILPKWELASNYTGTMIGYHSIPVIVDAYMKGIRDFNAMEALDAMIASTVYDTTGIHFPSEEVKEKLMPKAIYYNNTMEFIPSDLENESVSEALEYAYNDWCIAQMAKELGREDDYRIFLERSKRYKRYYDKETGFMRGVNSDGSWKTPFNPRYSRHRMDDYTEGNAFQWTWFVPHDVDGLEALMGGRQSFLAKLDTLFLTDSRIEGEAASVDISGLIGQYAHGNEPSHHITHLYNYGGEPWKTQKLADSILHSLYFNKPDGISGNEDCGQMSAWYILNAMGIYSVCPGDPVYSIGRPIFDEVEIQPEEGKLFVIKANNNSKKNCYIQSARLRGEPLDLPYISHEDILRGGVLEIEMGNRPNKKWGIAN
jgi:predicted alpha-1,2-mannosidase